MEGGKSKTPYCGTKSKVPKGTKKGTVVECAEKGQVRRFGVKKVSKGELERIQKSIEKKQEPKLNRKKIIIELTGARGRETKLVRSIAELEKKKKQGKEYDKEELKKYKKELPALRKRKTELVALMKEVEKKGGGIVLRGGKIPAKMLKELFEKDDFEDIGDYKMDKELSTEWVRVLHNPNSKHTIVVHRGSSDLYDAWIDMQLGLGYKNNKRFKESERIQKEAEKKYGTANMSVVGSSLGAVLAEDYGKNASEQITSGKPVVPIDLIVGKEPHKTQHDVRTKTDIISFLKPFQKHENDISVTSINPIDPLKSHLGRHTMEAVMKEKGDDVEIGEEGVGDKKGGQKNIDGTMISYESVMKMPVKNLKTFIVKNRKYTENQKKYNVGGKKKSELKELATDLFMNMC